MDCYEQRRDNLRAIGFSTYHEYLLSDLWNSIRGRVMKAAGRKCAVCKDAAKDVHHRSYSVEVLLGRANDHLSPLCRTCHDLIEFDSVGRKRTLLCANRELDKMIAINLLPMPVKEDRIDARLRRKREREEAAVVERQKRQREKSRIMAERRTASPMPKNTAKCSVCRNNYANASKGICGPCKRLGHVCAISKATH